MTNKEYFEKMSDVVLSKCKTEDDFINAYKEVIEYMNTHDVSRDDRMGFIESGAAEILAMTTQRYRRASEGQ